MFNNRIVRVIAYSDGAKAYHLDDNMPSPPSALTPKPEELHSLRSKNGLDFRHIWTRTQTDICRLIDRYL